MQLFPDKLLKEHHIAELGCFIHDLVKRLDAFNLELFNQLCFKHEYIGVVCNVCRVVFSSSINPFLIFISKGHSNLTHHVLLPHEDQGDCSCLVWLMLQPDRGERAEVFHSIDYLGLHHHLFLVELVIQVLHCQDILLAFVFVLYIAGAFCYGAEARS